MKLNLTLGSTLPQRIGSTPLIRLDRPVLGLEGIALLGKAEWANPGGSIKDRAAASMVQDARDRGLLVPGKTLLDATSGNTGISFAMLGAALGFPVLLAMPSNVSPERKRILRAYGAEVDWTGPGLGSDGAIRRARELAGNDPERFCYVDQYSNDANWLAHYRTTGPEIWEQTRGQVTHFVAGLGTSGTFMGTTRRLKELNPAIQAISFQPDSPFHGLEGMKHMGTSIVPAIYNPHLADRQLEVETEAAYAMAKQLARQEGLLVGISAAAAVVASLKIAAEEAEGWLVEAAVRAGNTRTDSAHNRYQIAPVELVKIEREARRQGLDIAGFYHSHPDHPAQWSPTDFAEAHWLGCCYVITSVAQGKATVTNSFLLAGATEEDKRFEQETIQVDDQSTGQIRNPI
jgi:cysteine synthase B